ncbi:MAG: twin-arginine translocase subunit TatB [Thiotrichaceae bacterium]|nr:twin-arginine translocase subunit TatB [Thiotrichaceae bacterium]
MFDSGFLELLIVGVIALLVVGPERLPEVAAKAGKFIGKMKAFVATTREDIEKEIRSEELQTMLNKQKDEISELRDMMQNTKSDVSDEFSEASDLLDSSVSEAKTALDKK